MDDIEFYKEDSETEREKIRADRDVMKGEKLKEIIETISENILLVLMLIFVLVLYVMMLKGSR